jgi:drug/metabolite transporter (DMT)-like permease
LKFSITISPHHQRQNDPHEKPLQKLHFRVESAAIKPATTLFAAMYLYGITSVAWVWVLQKVELGRVYPLMALAFVLVPPGSHFVFGERFHSQYFVGVAMIMAGIIIAVKA